MSWIGYQSYLYLHNWYSSVNGWDWDTVYINPGYDTALSFEMKGFKLLESPYSTNCIDYRETTPFLSRSQCLTDCSIRRGLDRCGVIPEDTNVEADQSGRLARTKEETKCTKRLNLTHYCRDICPNPDCTKHFFKALNFYTRLSSDYPNEALVSFKIPSEPQTIYNYRPKLETIEFLCYGASLTGLWFGFSIASIYYPIKHIIDWFDSRNTKRKVAFNCRTTHKIVSSNKLFDSMSFRNSSLYSTSTTFGRIKSI